MRSISTFALVLAGTAASADIAPDDLWQRWTTGAGAISVVEGTAREEDGTLVVEGAVLRLGRGETAPRLAASTLRLVPVEGTTRIVPPESWTVTGGEGVEARVTAPELDLVVGGAPDAPVYRVEEAALGATATVSDAGSSTGLTLTAEDLLAEIDPATGLGLTAAALDLRAVPAADAPESVSVAYEGLHLSFEGPLAAFSAPATEGVPFAMSLEAEAGRHVASAVSDQTGPITATVASGPVRTSVSSSEVRVDALSSMSGVTLTAEGPALPLTDARVEIAALSLGVSSPAAPVEGPEPVSVDLGLAGVSPGEQIWQLFDPEGALPRDPAELRLSASGVLSWDMAADPPAPALERAQLETLRLSALGAALTGQGGVQFNPPATPGTPGRPLGALGFTLEGANALLDRLSGLSSVPQGQLLGLRMGLGLFTRPGEGEDTVTTEIEFAPDGAIVVNGTMIGRQP